MDWENSCLQPKDENGGCFTPADEATIVQPCYRHFLCLPKNSTDNVPLPSDQNSGLTGGQFALIVIAVFFALVILTFFCLSPRPYQQCVNMRAVYFRENIQCCQL